MANESDRNRESLRRGDPGEKEKQTTPGPHQGSDEYSREGRDKSTSGIPGEESGSSGRERERGGRTGQRSGSSGQGSSDAEEER
ncbi:MAG: hypothetical protein ACM3SU_02485 [Acidobacteriota bacterium]